MSTSTHTVTLPNSYIRVDRTTTSLRDDSDLDDLVIKLNTHPGAVFVSNYEYPDRYTRWDIGFVDPPLMLTTHGLRFSLKSLTKRGDKLLIWIRNIMENNFLPKWLVVDKVGGTGLKCITGRVVVDNQTYTEGNRTRRPSVIQLVKYLKRLMCSESPDDKLGWYGSFGYQLVNQFEDLPITEDNRDMVLYLPDTIIVVDRHLQTYYRYEYSFSMGDDNTLGLSGELLLDTDTASSLAQFPDNPIPGSYAQAVHEIKPLFQQGEMFECVLSQEFSRRWTGSPAMLFEKLLVTNPSPYSFFLNLLDGEHLVGASPEMFVRVKGSRVETCPISGTIARGEDAIQDSAQVATLLNSQKDESELIMCVDIDRNDKSRVCLPGSVKVLAHRQIEKYSRLFHTVDHVEGYLRPGYDALDALQSHMWAVTVTGAPKRRALEYIQSHETTPRQWYGGAVGMVYLNGDCNTGMTLRTVHLTKGVAKIRVGATLLWDSIPEAEEAETILKGSALMDLLEKLQPQLETDVLAGGGVEGEVSVEGGHTPPPVLPGTGKRVLLVDYSDSFIHIIASYLEQLGAQVTCLRHYLIDKHTHLTPYSLVVLSPGPGKPGDYQIKPLINRCIGLDIPILGICLGHQALLEYFGGKLHVLSEPWHGKSREITLVHPSRMFTQLGSTMTVGLYHSLYAKASEIPQFLQVTASSVSDDILMGFQHNCLPIYGIQFHMESLMSDAKLARLMFKNILNPGDSQSTDISDLSLQMR